MLRLFLGFFLGVLAMAASCQVPDFQNLSNSTGTVIFLSTKRSGSNLVSASLGIITRKPISWLCWQDRVFERCTRRNPTTSGVGLGGLSVRSGGHLRSLTVGESPPFEGGVLQF